MLHSKAFIRRAAAGNVHIELPKDMQGEAHSDEDENSDVEHKGKRQLRGSDGDESAGEGGESGDESGGDTKVKRKKSEVKQAKAKKVEVKQAKAKKVEVKQAEAKKALKRKRKSDGNDADDANKGSKVKRVKVMKQKDSEESGAHATKSRPRRRVKN